MNTKNYHVKPPGQGIAVAWWVLGVLRLVSRLNENSQVLRLHNGNEMNSADVIELRPNEDPHGAVFARDLRSIVDLYIERGTLTWANIIGVLATEQMRVYTLLQEAE